MVLKKRLLASLALTFVCFSIVFAADATPVDTAGENNTYVGAEGDTDISSSVKTSTTLATSTGNTDDIVNLLADIPQEDLTTSLYYNENIVTSDEGLYDADWNLTSGFTTNTFVVGVKGSTGVSGVLNVVVGATPFAIVDSRNEAIATAGAMTVNAGLKGTASTVNGLQTATVYGKNTATAYRIKSDPIVADVYYDPSLAITVIDVREGVTTGKVVSFTLTTEGKDELPSGRYQSTVTLLYSLE